MTTRSSIAAGIPSLFRRPSTLLLTLAALALGLVFAPRAFAGLSESQGMVTITWTGNADPNSSDDTDYLVYRGVNGGALSYYHAVPKTTFTYVDGGVFNRSTFSYDVCASNNAGNGTASSTVPVVVQLAAPSLTHTATNVCPFLQWDPVPDANGAYYVYRSTD